MPAKRDLLISRGWIHAILIVRLCGFLLFGILAYRTYTDEPPIPSNVVSVTSQVLFTDQDIRTGLLPQRHTACFSSIVGAMQPCANKQDENRR